MSELGLELHVWAYNSEKQIEISKLMHQTNNYPTLEQALLLTKTYGLKTM